MQMAMPAQPSARFVITGCGRSGTLFLANALGRSRRFIVRHEHEDDHRGWFQLHGTYNRDGHLALARQRFEAHDNYGEVNSFLRYIVADLPVDKRSVIIRNPLDLAMSAINKFPLSWMGMHGFTERVHHLKADLKAVQRLIDAHYPVWRFERFIAEPDYMAQIIDWAGIDDVQPLSIRYGAGGKVNAAGREFCPQVSQLLPAHRNLLRDNLRWFADEHYPGTWTA